MTTDSINFTQTLSTCTCYKCGIVFGMPAYFKEQRIEDHLSFFCPSGHSQAFVGETEAEKLRKQLVAEQSRVAGITAKLDQERAQRKATERQLSATKAVVTKTKKRMAGGASCPCCNRYFKNVHAHIKTKHPDYVVN